MALSPKDTGGERKDRSRSRGSTGNQALSHRRTSSLPPPPSHGIDHANGGEVVFRVPEDHQDYFGQGSHQLTAEQPLSIRRRRRIPGLLEHLRTRIFGGDPANGENESLLSRPETPRSYGSVGTGTPGSPFGAPGSYEASNKHGPLGSRPVPPTIVGGAHEQAGPPRTLSRSSTTQALAQKHGVRHTRLMYLDYYLPILRWTKQYHWKFLAGDFAAALTMASMYIPMSLSYASNLGHVPPINGLYAFVFNPLVYAILGTCPTMVVGPEAAGSLLTGNVVRDSIRKGGSHMDENLLHAQIAGVVTGFAGLILFAAGLFRLGFLDNVLSRPFLRGFISALGFVIFITQMIPMFGLAKEAEGDDTAQNGSTVDKLVFIFKHIQYSHRVTALLSWGAFVVIMACRTIKRLLQKRFPLAAFIPDRFAIVVLSTILTWRFRWDQLGLDILGDIRSQTGRPFPAHFPLDFSHMKHLESALTTSFLVALLGFFESSVAARSLGNNVPDGLPSATLSANRELVALGAANIIGGTFMAIPAFGGYGRSKVNLSTGGKTPMSSILLSLITLICILALLPYLYFVPKGVLSAMIAVVAYSLVEEAPHDLIFFWKIRAWTELFLIFLVFLATIFYSLPLGIACGIGFSLLRVIRHATRPRIQILGRVPGTSDRFENAEADPDRLEFIEGCLIVKIPEPLTFANTADLKARLRRLEDYGTPAAHPALPRVRDSDNNRNLVFDVHGVTGLDGAGAQVLSEIVAEYRGKGTRIFFARLPHVRNVERLFLSSGIIEMCGGEEHFLPSVYDALQKTQVEDLARDRAADAYPPA